MSGTMVRAGQLVFARVEAAYSPRAQPGYQVLWASASLPPPVRAEITERVRCFVASPGRDERLQFAALQAGGCFVSRTAQQPASVGVHDRDGRTTFLARAAWLDAEGWTAVDGDPFALLAALPGADIDALVAAFGQASGVAPELEVAMGAAAASSADVGVAVLPLVAGILAPGDGEASPPIFLRGSGEQVEAVLRALVALLPPSERGRCSFNTVADGCPPWAGYRFVAGAHRPPAQAVAVVDLAAPRSGAAAGPPAASYVAWLARALAARPLAAVSLQTETAYRACLALCGDAAAGLADGVALDPEVCREVLAHEEDQLHRRLLAWSRRGLLPRARQRCCRWLLRELVAAAPERLVAGLLRPFPTPVEGG